MDDFGKVSENIRKAFRLLMIFTKSFHGIVKFIECELGLKFINDSQFWRSPPQNGTRNLDNKEWPDWFPLYYHIFNFQKGKTSAFSIILQCDTGYWDYYAGDKKAENFFLKADEIEVDKYASVSAAKTKIIFGAINKANVDIIGQIFDGFSHDENKIAENWANITKDYKKEFSLSTGGRNDKEIFFRVYELSEFRDEQTTKKSVVDFVAYLKKNGITGFEIAQ
jgi:hypothetical protein